jgi:methionyl-tRNA formyltransferase
VLTVEIVFLVAKPIGLGCLEITLDEIDLGLDAKIVGVGTGERGDECLKLANERNLFTFGDPDQIPQCDLLLSIQYDRIVTSDVISRCGTAINLHLAPLPEYRGCNQFSFAIVDGASHFGATLHLMEAEVDSGDIVYERRFDISENVTVSELHDRTVLEALDLFSESLKSIIENDFPRTPQFTLVEERGSSVHYRKEIEELKKIDLAWSVDRIERHIRATSMPGFPPPFTMINGIRYSIVIEK